MKKYKIKKRKKFLNSYIIFAIFTISILFISTGYAILSDSLNIIGKANILLSNAPPQGKSTYSYETTSTWPGNNSSVIYAVTVNILNLDETYYSDITISFDVPDGFDLELSNNNLNVWQAESISQTGNTVTIVFTHYDWYTFELNSTLSLYLQLPYKYETDVTISNLVLNGKTVQNVPSQTKKSPKK